MPNQSQYEAAFEKGREILRERRRFGREVEAGEAKLSRVLVPFTGDLEKDHRLLGSPTIPEWLKNVRLGLMLRWLPGIGPATVEKILGQVPCENFVPGVHPDVSYGIPCSPADQLSSLSYRQRVSLSLLIERWEK